LGAVRHSGSTSPDESGCVAFERSDKKIAWMSDFEATAKPAEQVNSTDWPACLSRQVAMVNPLSGHRRSAVRR